MKAKKRINLSIPLWWPSSPGWRRLARWLLPIPGNVLFTVLVAMLLPFGFAMGPNGSSIATSPFLIYI